MTDKDIIIIGGGAAGLSAGIFASRLGLNTLLLERLMPGGQVINAEVIEDYPGLRIPYQELNLSEKCKSKLWQSVQKSVFLKSQASHA